MCLILFANRPNEKYRLVVAANRDEFYDRPATRAGYWQDHPQILAGRDIQAGGTWLGVTRNGRFAAVTNFRETPPEPLPPLSRGELTRGFLAGSMSAADYVNDLQATRDEFRGYNLVVDDGQQCCYYCNRGAEPMVLTPGFYGLSNQQLDCDWPKVIEGREALRHLVNDNDHVEPESLLTLLTQTGDGTPFSNSFIESAEYGTCAATLMTISTTGDVSFTEQGYAHQGRDTGREHFAFTATR